MKEQLILKTGTGQWLYACTVHGLKFPCLVCANMYLSDNAFCSSTNGGLDAHQNWATPHDGEQRGIWTHLNHSNRRLPGTQDTRSPVCCSKITTSKKNYINALLQSSNCTTAIQFYATSAPLMLELYLRRHSLSYSHKYPRGNPVAPRDNTSNVLKF